MGKGFHNRKLDRMNQALAMAQSLTISKRGSNDEDCADDDDFEAENSQTDHVDRKNMVDEGDRSV